MFTIDETDRVVRTTDNRVIGTTDRVMRTTDVRVVRTTDIENVRIISGGDVWKATTNDAK